MLVQRRFSVGHHGPWSDAGACRFQEKSKKMKHDYLQIRWYRNPGLANCQAPNASATVQAVVPSNDSGNLTTPDHNHSGSQIVILWCRVRSYGSKLDCARRLWQVGWLSRKLKRADSGESERRAPPGPSRAPSNETIALLASPPPLIPFPRFNLLTFHHLNPPVDIHSHLPNL